MGESDGPFVFEALQEREGRRVSRSPWGEDDEIGRLNWITPDSRRAILDHLDGRGVFDLSVDYFIGMPSWSAAGDPKFDAWMTHTPRGSIVDGLSGTPAEVHERYSYCGDSFAMYSHCGTHIDTLTHMGFDGLFWNGWKPARDLGSRVWAKGGANRYPPIIARCLMLDVAGLHGIEELPDSHPISADDVRAALREQSLEVRRGDVVLVRTGRMRRWPDASYADDQPGMTVAAARHLLEEEGAMCIGTDTMSFEVLPSLEADVFLPVHTYMLATAGAQLIEIVPMEELAAEGLDEFAFVGFPLKLIGMTGAPIRPIAVPLRD
ncbi:MAG: cyclase family protein [Solirubrobacterales bacterium]